MLAKGKSWRLAATAVLAACGPWAVTAHATEDALVPPFSATYKVRYGLLSGTMSLELRRSGGEYVYETSLSPRGVASWLRRGEIRETTRLVPDGGSVRPLDYTNTDTIARPNRHASYTFDESSQAVSGEYKSRVIDETMRAGGQNRISAHVALIQAMRSGEEISDFPVFDRGRWKDYRFEVLPEQPVETPSGDFDAVEIRYTSADDDRNWSLYLAEDLDYLPVVIVFREGDKTKSRAELTSYRFTDEREPLETRLE